MKSTSKRTVYLWAVVEVILGVIATGSIINVVLTLMGSPDGDTPLYAAIFAAGFWSLLTYVADRKRRGTAMTKISKSNNVD